MHWYGNPGRVCFFLEGQRLEIMNTISTKMKFKGKGIGTCEEYKPLEGSSNPYLKTFTYYIL